MISAAKYLLIVSALIWSNLLFAQLEFKSEKRGKIKVKGTAHPAHSGALIITKKDHYYLSNDELAEWPEDYLGKRVKVKGELLFVTRSKKPGDKGIYSYIPEMNVITDFKLRKRCCGIQRDYKKWLKELEESKN